VLTLLELPSWRYYAYLGLYDLAYMFDDALVFSLAVAALGAHRLSERVGRLARRALGSAALRAGGSSDAAARVADAVRESLGADRARR
jgi:hypothetical protein